MLKLAVFAVAVVAVMALPKPEEERYKSRLDSINVDEVLKNQRLVDNYIKCALGTGKCTPEGTDIKEQILNLIPEILETNCAKCTADQKEKVSKMLDYMAKNKPAECKQIVDKYDPNNELREKYKSKREELKGEYNGALCGLD